MAIPHPSGTAVFARDVFSGGLAGTLAGFLFLGIGSRLLMRYIAVLNPFPARVMTDNGAISGEITAEGTMDVLLIIGLAGGMLVGILWVIVREWIPTSVGIRVVAAGVIAMLVGSFAFLEADNRDFLLFGPPLFIVVSFMLLTAFAGAGAAFGDHILSKRLPSTAVAGWFYRVLIAFGALVGLMFLIAGFFTDFLVSEPPRLVGLFILITATATLLSFSRYLPARFQLPNQLPKIRVLGVVRVLAMCLFGATHLAGQVNRIVT